MLSYTTLVFILIVNVNRAVTIWSMYDGTGVNFATDTSVNPVGSSDVTTITDNHCSSGACLKIHATNQAGSWARWDPSFSVTSYISLSLSFKYYHNGKNTDGTRECHWAYGCTGFNSVNMDFAIHQNEEIWTEDLSVCDKSIGDLTMTFYCTGNDGSTNSGNLFIDDFLLTGYPAPTEPSDPTQSPITGHPTHITTSYPSTNPTSDPTTDPTNDPSKDPTKDPTTNPTTNPSIYPT
eukprot:61606_1